MGMFYTDDAHTLAYSAFSHRQWCVVGIGKPTCQSNCADTHATPGDYVWYMAICIGHSSEPDLRLQGRKNGAYGHAVGPKWTDTISAHAGQGELVVEQNCEFDRLVWPDELVTQLPMASRFGLSTSLWKTY